MALYRDLKNFNEEFYDKEAIDNAIVNILTTKKGSVPGKPNFGTDLQNILFDFVDHTTHDFVLTVISDALYNYEPRVRVEDINIELQPEYNRLIIDIFYRYTFIKSVDQAKTRIVINT